MRTCKDAKAMAKSLRGSLAARNISLSHSECLEIVAMQFGFADWNTLSTKVSGEQLSCSFCGKSQDEVRTLIEGGCSNNRGVSSCVFICDECVAFSARINADTACNAKGTHTAPRRDAPANQE